MRRPITSFARGELGVAMPSSGLRRCAPEHGRAAEERLASTNRELEVVRQSRQARRARLDEILERARCAGSFAAASAALDEVDRLPPPRAWSVGDAAAMRLDETCRRQETDADRRAAAQLRSFLRSAAEPRTERSREVPEIKKMSESRQREDLEETLLDDYCALAQAALRRGDAARRAALGDKRRATLAANAALNRRDADARGAAEPEDVTTHNPTDAVVCVHRGRGAFLLRTLANRQARVRPPPFAVDSTADDLPRHLPRCRAAQYATQATSFRRKSAEWFYD